MSLMNLIILIKKVMYTKVLSHFLIDNKISKKIIFLDLRLLYSYS